ncbi:MAG: hypothetical protein HKN21_13330, partial [Candidatus Eisenbacteria bacterium]|nr:hypothetical protein [Candidatus Eisenbacteria bacterium]
DQGVKVPDKEGAYKTASADRADRRAYDGAPPVIPHESFKMACRECHGSEGIYIQDLGYSPPSPHEMTSGMSAESRCQQCHVFQNTTASFKPTTFEGLAQDLGSGSRFWEGSPPTIPHQVFMRENCAACHSGPAAREEIRTTHPERERCQQCHVPQASQNTFSRQGDE